MELRPVFAPILKGEQDLVFDGQLRLPVFFCVRLSSARTNSHIRWKVSGLMPQYRLKCAGDSVLMFS